MKLSFIALALVVVTGCAAVTGCASATDSDAASSSDDLTASTPELVGTFNIAGATNETIFNSLTLNADKTFAGTGGCRQDGPGLHCGAITSITGTWRTLTSGPELGAPAGAAEIELTDSFGQKTTYFYKLGAGGSLSLMTSLTGGTASAFTKVVTPAPAAVAEVPAALLGSFSLSGTANTTGWRSLTLNSDDTFTARGGCAGSTGSVGAVVHCGAISLTEGTFTVGKSGPELGSPGGADEIVFTDQFGQKSTYFYNVSDTGLTLSAGLIGTKTVFDKSAE